MSQEDRQKAWTQIAGRLRRRVNLAWWYQELTIPLVSLALIAGGWVVASRRYGWLLGTEFWVVLSLVAVLVFALTWYRSKRKWLDLKGAFVRLEADLGLHNSLSTAVAERGAWPDPAKAKPVVRWNPSHVALPILSALAFLFLGFLVPIAPAGEAEPENQPYTWGRLEAEVEELVENEIIQEDYADKLKERLEELRNQKAAEWFSAASLEATDSLQQAHTREANRLERDLMRVEQALKKAADPKTTDEQRRQLQQQFQEALEGIRGGQMKPNKELLKKLEEAAEKGMQGLTPEQKEELQQKMREMAERLRQQQGEPRPGEGEPQQGPGAFEDLFGDKSPDLELKKFERLDGEDSEDQDPGDLLKLEELEHDLDLSQQGPTASGAAKSEGLGGDRVWKDALDPDEQKSLKSFFE